MQDPQEEPLQELTTPHAAAATSPDEGESCERDEPHTTILEGGDQAEEPHKEEPLPPSDIEPPTRRKRSPRELWQQGKAYLSNHWWIIHASLVGLFIVFVLILGESNLYQQIKLSRRISTLERKIERAEKQYKTDKTYLDNRLKNEAYDIETLARKKCGLKKEGEMVFILIDTLDSEYNQSNGFIR